MFKQEKSNDIVLSFKEKEKRYYWSNGTMDYVPTTANSLSHSHKTIPLKCVINGTTDYVPTTAKSVSQTHKTVHLIRTLLCV